MYTSDICKICRIPLGRDDSRDHLECAVCGCAVCDHCLVRFSEAMLEIDGKELCAECQSAPAIPDLRPFLRSGEHFVRSHDGKETRWFGVRRCVESDGYIRGWLLSHNGKIKACETPLEVEAAIKGMF